MKTNKNPRILIAMDSFKGSATSLEIGSFVKAGILSVEPQAEVTVIPVADGGEGTVEALVTGLGGNYEWARVCGPLGKPVMARYGLLPGNQAVIEMAAASGLTLIGESERDPFRTSTYGTGQLIQEVLKKGVEHIYIGIGGSATNDGGVGMAQAIGISFLDKTGKQIKSGASGLAELHSINFGSLDQRIRKLEITVLTDVNNPLCGKYGASYVFGVQKGARLEDLEKLDQSIHHLADVVNDVTGVDYASIPGSGAAGGLGFGLLAFCGAKIKPGVETILDLVRIDENLKVADCVITGEGRLDEQSLYGKAPIGIAGRAKKFGLSVIAIVGSLGISLDAASKAGIDTVLELQTQLMPLKEALQNAPSLARLAGEKAIRTYLSRQSI